MPYGSGSAVRRETTPNILVNILHRPAACHTQLHRGTVQGPRWFSLAKRCTHHPSRRRNPYTLAIGLRHSVSQILQRRGRQVPGLRLSTRRLGPRRPTPAREMDQIAEADHLGRFVWIRSRTSSWSRKPVEGGAILGRWSLKFSDSSRRKIAGKLHLARLSWRWHRSVGKSLWPDPRSGGQGTRPFRPMIPARSRASASTYAHTPMGAITPPATHRHQHPGRGRTR